MSWIQTRTGAKFDVLDPRPSLIDPRDIAWALAHQCRFSGHTSRFYSVAQHSVLVSLECAPDDALAGLLHDATEAYLCDLPRPIKRHTVCGHHYRLMESRVWEAVATRFGISCDLPPSVERADVKLLATEARDLMAPLHPEWTTGGPGSEALADRIVAVGPADALAMFAARFDELGVEPVDWIFPKPEALT